MEAFEAAEKIAAQNDVDWDALLSLACEEGVAPLLYHAARDRGLLPSRVEQAVRLSYLSTAGRNVDLFHRLERVLTSLSKEGLPVMVLKGAALVEAVYGNVALRPMVDADLLVRESDVPAVLSILTALDYQSCSVKGLLARDIHTNQLMVRRPGSTQAPIEIHWALFWFPYYQEKVPMEWFWRTALPIQLGDISARVLGLEAQLLHLSGHLLHHRGSDGQYRMLWLHDVAELIVRRGRQLDWGQLLTKAKAYDLVLPLKEVLTQVSEAWPGPIPPEVLEQVCSLCPSRNEKRAFAWLTSISSHSMDRYALASLAAMPDWRSQLGFLWHELLFPSVRFMQRRYGIERLPLVPLYYPYRWLSGLIRLARPRR